ncbi:SGNH/GDSL hydrolase family protein [Georgenia sp. 10Sc9-8]|uniref:SGNH/GDSL hydrolase family protein n=1 Tax=Georgenia halotolerans TaxID=3028317 RepID=A0ABT5TXD7_9MICO|nr:SGNH/GDSL hydrolase family protein [Georgenia halotolerans]
MALGDSMTEGLWDLDPQEPSRTRGWADLLATTLSRRRMDSGLEPLHYANLAVRGRLLGQIIDEQLPTALELRPELVSLVGAGNDILRPGVDIDALVHRLEDAVTELRAAGIDVLLATGVDPVASPVIRATRGRVGVYNAYVWTVARRHGAHVLDVWGARSLRDWRMWADDRIHLTTEGHARVAQAALVALGQHPDDQAWDDPLAPLPQEAFGERLRGNVDWLRQYAYPWARRRLRGRSSGDARHPKIPELTPLHPTAPDHEEHA